MTASQSQVTRAIESGARNVTAIAKQTGMASAAVRATCQSLLWANYIVATHEGYKTNAKR